MLSTQAVLSARSVTSPTVYLRMRGRNVVLRPDQRVLRIRKAKKLPRRRADPYCSTTDCISKSQARGLCKRCYLQAGASGALPEPLDQTAPHAVELVSPLQVVRGDCVVVLDRLPAAPDASVTLDDGSLFGWPVTERLAWLWGAIVGDGTVSTSDVRVAAFGEFREQVAAAFDEVYSLHCIPHWSAGLIVGNADLARTLRSFGFWRRGEGKRVPEVVWSWPTGLQLAFCAGYAAADGYFDPRPGGGQRYDSCSRRLLDEVRTLHIMAGHRVTNVTTNMRKQPIFINGKRVKQAKPLHNFVVSSREAEPYAGIPRAIVSDVVDHTFGLRVVLGVDEGEWVTTRDLRLDGGAGVVVDGVPVWPAEEAVSALDVAA